MPVPHRNFLEALERMPSIREYSKISGNPKLVACYNSTVEALVGFRKMHFSLVRSYIVIPSGDTEEIGTGGTILKTFLKKTLKNSKYMIL